MAAPVPQHVDRAHMGPRLLLVPRDHVRASSVDVFLQHGADAQTSAVPGADDRAGWIRRGAWTDRPDPFHSGGARSRERYFLVCGQSCCVYVSLYLVSWHVPALSI